jgi:hypothetical protein
MAEIVLPSEFTRTPAHRTPPVTRGLALVAAFWRKLTRNLGASYRPERHYMRGPGPKWHALNSGPPRY